MSWVHFGAVAFLCSLIGATADAAAVQRLYQAKYTVESGRAELFFEGETNSLRSLGAGEVAEKQYPRHIVEHEKLGEARVVELLSPSRQKIKDLLRKRGVVLPEGGLPVSEDSDELITIIESGPSKNRIDLVFMGDGYTENEREKFEADMRRLTKDMFEGNTFRSYLPLFNVYAVFRASNESGIGKNSRPKDTAFGLYRVGETLRVIQVANRTAAHAACQAAPECDFPILIGNDPYYGGLGGEFAVSTSSPSSGTVVLRHELGHNFGNIGEEYDGGGYFGANHSSSATNPSWKHWLTGEAKAEPAKSLYVGWPWHHLSEKPLEITLNTVVGDFVAYDVDLSLSGMESDEDIWVTLDGNRLPVKSPGNSDRFYSLMNFPGTLAPGVRKLRFEEKVKDGNNWVSNIKISQFGRRYHFEKGYISAYPLFDEGLGVDGYRPTHEGCLMRKMPHDRFCSVCQENNWLNFFTTVSVIDETGTEVVSGERKLFVKPVALGQLRTGGALEGERLDIKWFNNGVEQTELSGQTEITPGSAGKWEVEVTYVTAEVRKDPSHRLSARKTVATF